MREILFRGKRVDNSEWVQGFYWASLDPCTKQTKYRGCFVHNGVNISDPIEVDPKTTGQYIGLKDKNGVKIFEGDKLKIHKDYKYKHNGFGRESTKIDVFRVFIVGYNADKMKFEFKSEKKTPSHLETGTNEIEVIGNIHDKN